MKTDTVAYNKHTLNYAYVCVYNSAITVTTANSEVLCNDF